MTHCRYALSRRYAFGSLCCKFPARREHMYDEWTFIIVEQLTGLAQTNSHRLGIGVRKPSIHRTSGAMRSSVLERVAHKTDGHLAFARSVMGVINGAPLGNITLSPYHSIGS